MTSDDVADRLDPQSIKTVRDLGLQMKRLLARAGLSYGMLNQWARDHGYHDTPLSTISNVMNGQYPPSPDLLNSVLGACQVPEAEVERWRLALSRASERHKIKELDGDRQLDGPLELVTDRLAEAEEEIRRLRHHEAELQAQLESATAESARLEEKLQGLHADLVNKSNLTSELVKQLEERRLAAEHERELVDERIRALRNELNLTTSEREHLEKELERLQTEYNGLSEASEHIQALLELHFERAEVERRHREKAELENRKLSAEVDELRPLLTHYQHEANKDEPRQIERSLLERLRNQDFRVELTAKRSDFGHTRQVLVPLGWQCPQCKRGGIRPYPICPYDQAPTQRDTAKSIDVTLPDEPVYDKPVRIEGEGAHDDPAIQPGHLYVRLVPWPSVWQRIGRGMSYIFRGSQLERLTFAHRYVI